MKNFYALCIAFIFCVACVQAACPVTISAGGPTVFCTGDSVLLTASGGTGYTYQWKQNSAIIAGATAQTYMARTTGNYTVTVTVVSPACTTTSNSISVTAETPLSVTVTQNFSSMCGSSTDILESNFGPYYLYEWYEDTTLLPNNSYQLHCAHNGNYSCTITNTCGTYSSSSFVLNDSFLTNLSYAEISANGPTSICATSSVQLYISVFGNTSFSYQWYRNGVIIPWETDYVMTATQGGNYMVRFSEYCTWSGEYYFVYSNIIPVTILPGTLPAAAITAAGPTSFCAGQNVTLNADTATGWTYQWVFNNSNIPGATSSSYVATLSGLYYCRVSNLCGTVASNTIFVNVFPVAVNISPVGPTTICLGSIVMLNSFAAGTGGTYQWKLNGSNIPGATNASYAASAQGAYTCALTNSCGTFTSNSVIVTTSGVCSTGLQFDGSNDYVQIPHHTATDFGTGNFTLEAWVNLDVSQIASYPTLLSNRVQYSSGYWIYFYNGSLNVFLNGVNKQVGNDLRDRACHHIAISRSSTSLTSIYIDGILVGTITTTTGTVTVNAPLYIAMTAIIPGQAILP
jgi:hypothetical protein